MQGGRKWWGNAGRRAGGHRVRHSCPPWRPASTNRQESRPPRPDVLLPTSGRPPAGERTRVIAGALVAQAAGQALLQDGEFGVPWLVDCGAQRSGWRPVYWARKGGDVSRANVTQTCSPLPIHPHQRPPSLPPRRPAQDSPPLLHRSPPGILQLLARPSRLICSRALDSAPQAQPRPERPGREMEPTLPRASIEMWGMLQQGR